MNFTELSSALGPLRRSLFAGCVVALFSLAASAKNLSSDVLLVIPKEELRRHAILQSGELEVLRESLTISGELPVVLRQLKAKIRYEVDSLTPGENGQFEMVLRIPQARLRAEGLGIDTVLEVKSGGVRARIPVKASCQGLQIENREELRFSLKAQWEDSPSLRVSVQELQWLRRPGQWALQSESCQAAPGFLPFLEEQISKLWQESEELPLTLKEELNTQLAGWFNETLNLKDEISRLATRLHLQGRRMMDTPEAWVFGLDLGLEIGSDPNRICPSLRVPVHLSLSEMPSHLNELELRFPEKLLEVWVRCLHEQGLLTRYDRGQDIAGFRQLLNSRFLQFFVWSDLMRFPKSTAFQFQSFSNGPFRLEALPAAGGVSYALQTQIVSHLSHPVNERWHPYMTFWSPVTAAIQLKVADSKLKIGMLGTPRTHLQYRYDVPEARGLVSVGLVESQVKDYLKGQSFEVELPQIQFEGVTLKASGIERSGSALRFKLDLKR